MDHIVCNAEKQDGTEHPTVGPGAPLDNKFLFTPDGLLPLSGAHLKALGYDSSYPGLGKPLTNAELAKIGYYTPGDGGPVDFKGPIALSLSLSGGASGTVG